MKPERVHPRDGDEDWMDDVLSIHASPSGRSIPTEAWAHVPTKKEALAARALAQGHPELGWSILQGEITVEGHYQLDALLSGRLSLQD